MRRGLCIATNQYERPLILGIETSCDDTGAAMGNILTSFVNFHLIKSILFNSRFSWYHPRRGSCVSNEQAFIIWGNNSTGGS